MIFYTFITNNIIKGKCGIDLNYSVVLQRAKYLSILETGFCKLSETRVVENWIPYHYYVNFSQLFPSLHTKYRVRLI